MEFHPLVLFNKDYGFDWKVVAQKVRLNPKKEHLCFQFYLQIWQNPWAVKEVYKLCSVSAWNLVHSCAKRQVSASVKI